MFGSELGLLVGPLRIFGLLAGFFFSLLSGFFFSLLAGFLFSLLAGFFFSLLSPDLVFRVSTKSFLFTVVSGTNTGAGGAIGCRKRTWTTGRRSSPNGVWGDTMSQSVDTGIFR